MLTDSVFIQRGGKLGWLVRVNTTFKNFGPDTVVQIGFPFGYYDPGEIDTLPNGEYCNANPEFQVKVNGRSVRTYPKRGIENPDLDNLKFALVYTFHVRFKKGEMKSVIQTYTVGGGGNSIGERYFNYILKTGSLWKDSIKSLFISLKLSRKDVKYWQSISPQVSDTKQTGKSIEFHWRYENVKPDSDIELYHHPDL